MLQCVCDRFFPKINSDNNLKQLEQTYLKIGHALKQGQNLIISCNKLLDTVGLPVNIKSKYKIIKNNTNDQLYIQLDTTIYNTTMINNSKIMKYPLQVHIIGFSVNDIGTIKIEISYDFKLNIHNLVTNYKTSTPLNIQETDINILWITDTLFIIYTDINIYIYQIIIYNDYSTSLFINDGNDFQLNSNNKQIKKIIKLSETCVGILYNNEFKLFKIKYNSNNITIKEIYNTSLLNYEEYYHITQYNTKQNNYVLLFSTNYVHKLNISTKKLTQINYKEDNMQLSNIINIIIHNKYIIICYDFCIKFYNLELYLLKKQTVDNKIVIFEMIDNKIMTISSDDEILRLYDIYDTNIKSTHKNITKSLTKCKSNSLIIR